MAIKEDHIDGRDILKSDKRAQRLLRQFMNNGGTGTINTKEYQAGYVYAFRFNEEQKAVVASLQDSGLDFSDAVKTVENDTIETQDE